MSHPTEVDVRWLDAAARYATPFLGTTAENPTVAALLVDALDDRLIARAVTAKGGRPHAETQAIEAAGFGAAGATLYVTLEPCHHWGRTPPCVDAIIRSGIMRVVIGASDTNPHTKGESTLRLESAGIEVVHANHAPSIALSAGHTMLHIAGRPLVTAVLNVSADGMIARRGEGRGDMLGAPARQWAELLRTRSEAVLIGAATAGIDNPALTVTIPGLQSRTPLRLILAGANGVDRNVNLISGFSGHRTAIIAENTAALDLPASIQTMQVDGSNGRPDLAATMQMLGKKGVQNLLAEPGARLLSALLDAELIDRLALISSPREIGADGVPASAHGSIVEILELAGLIASDSESLGEDVLTIYQRTA